MRRERLARLLPEVFLRVIEPQSPLLAALETMEALHEPAEATLGRLDEFFNPRRTPDRFVDYLARWVDLDLPITTGPGRRRELIAEAVALSHLRGTRAALLRFLTVATGIAGFEIDEAPAQGTGSSRPFHIIVRAPPESLAHEIMIRRIIELEKPAHVTYKLVAKEAAGKE